MKVPKTTEKREIKVRVNIKPVKLADVTPAQRAAWRKFWQKLISEVKADER